MMMVTLFVALVVGICVHSSYGKTVFINTTTGVDNTACWTGGEELPCKDLDLALEGARKLNSTIVFAEQCECNEEQINVASIQEPNDLTMYMSSSLVYSNK